MSEKFTGGGGGGTSAVGFGGSSDNVHIAFRQGSQEWLLWEILTELKAIRRGLEKKEGE